MTILDASRCSTASGFIAADEQWSTHNYYPLPVVITSGCGPWVTDVAGRHYLDFQAGYSALNFGHRHPALVAAAMNWLGQVTLTSRAFHHDLLDAFCRELAELTGTDMVLPMNSGAEAVESAIKVAGKALGGGILPVSAVVGRRAVLGVLRPGEHGSTFGGNPLACAVGRAVIALLATGEFQHRSRELGAHLHARLGELVGRGVTRVTGRGLWAGVQIAAGGLSGRAASEALMARGVLCKETHSTTLRIAPPLVITRSELDTGLDAITDVLAA